MCCDNAYTSKYRSKNNPPSLKNGGCICDCKLVRSLKESEGKSNPFTSAVPNVTILKSFITT